MSGKALLGRELGQQICEALGVDPSTVLSITLRCSAEDVVTAVIDRFVTDDEGVRIAAAVERYELTPVPLHMAGDDAPICGVTSTDLVEQPSQVTCPDCVRVMAGWATGASS